MWGESSRPARNGLDEGLASLAPARQLTSQALRKDTFDAVSFFLGRAECLARLRQKEVADSATSLCRSSIDL